MPFWIVNYNSAFVNCPTSSIWQQCNSLKRRNSKINKIQIFRPKFPNFWTQFDPLNDFVNNNLHIIIKHASIRVLLIIIIILLTKFAFKSKFKNYLPLISIKQFQTINPLHICLSKIETYRMLADFVHS